MKLYETSLDCDFAIIRKYNITMEQLHLVRMLFLSQQEGGSKYVYEYYTRFPHLFSIDNINVLVEAKIIKLSKSFKLGDDFDPDYMELNGTFKNGYLRDSYQLGNELWDKYPGYIYSSTGQAFPAKNISKKYDTLDDFFFAYGKQIKNSPKTHEEVLKALDYAIANNLLMTTIVEWVLSRKWEDYEAKEQFIDFV